MNNSDLQTIAGENRSVVVAATAPKSTTGQSAQHNHIGLFLNDDAGRSDWTDDRFAQAAATRVRLKAEGTGQADHHRRTVRRARSAGNSRQRITPQAGV